MPWYKSGTVSVVQNSNVVTGTNTAFFSNGRVGDAFRGPDGGWYEVINIPSETSLAISPNYLGATNATGAYALAPMQGYVKDSADALRSLVNQFGGVLAVLGQTPTTAGVRAALNLTNADGLPDGATNKYLTNARVLAVALTGLDVSAAGAVVATDSVLVALGKLQATKADLSTANKTVAIEQGGTGGNTQAAARNGLGLKTGALSDLVGTVAQSGGVATGAIIERGSNANGEYARYADGTQMCWKRTGTNLVNVASGSIFLSNAVGSGSYPMAFTSVPTVSAIACVAGYQWALWAANASEPTATTWGTYYAAAAASVSQGAFINIIAVGRWF